MAVIETQSDPPSLASYCGLMTSVHIYSLEHSDSLTHIPMQSDTALPVGTTVPGTPKDNMHTRAPL